MMSVRDDVGYQDLLWLLGSLSGFYRLPFDAALIAQEFPPPYAHVTLHEAARALGFKTGNVSITAIDWRTLPLPAIAFLRPALANEETASDAAPNQPLATPVLILKSDGSKLLYFRPGSQTPETISVEEAAQSFSDDLILVAKETTVGTAENADIPGFTSKKKAFGFKWFIPELLKHKTIWRDVLLASLAIQLVGLTTPLFTQVIIDKVVVHQSNSTLIVLGIALVMFMLFTSGMTWLRQYLVLHCGNRVDAVLGS